PDWRKHAGPNINTITFHDLMTHRSGFRENCSGARTTYAKLKDQITTGVTLSDKSKASYNNCNFAIFRELLPSMEGHPVSGSDTSRAAQSADFYIDYMNSHVFKPAGLSTRACKPPAAAQTVLSYTNPAGSSHGISWSDWTLACGGGGWVLSPQDLFQILNQLINGNHLLNDADKSLLLASPPNCIAWDCAQGAECPNPYVCKTGLLKSGDVVLQTYIGIFKCSTPVVVIMNSSREPVYTGGILGIVRDAYNAAKVSGKPKACPSSS
ncbi:MAG: serine hydrolase, partial [Candidatus Eremiobacteraeota bacterium]|nr:serine hydrolase [Candidatus Eremiobacteraeota bacterium]